MTTIDVRRRPRFEPVPTLGALRGLVRPLGAVASVYLSGGSSDAELRLRNLTESLARSGAPTATVEAVHTALAGHLDRTAQLALFASGDHVLASYELDGVASADLARWGTPAHVLPLSSWIAAHPPYVEVVADRTGADITAVTAGAVHGTTTVVVGADDEIECNAPGGWSQPRYQHRAADSWHRNAAAAAEATIHALSLTRARLLLVAGDLRAVHLMLDRMPERPLLVRRVTGGRAPDGSAAARAAEVKRARAVYADRIRAAATAGLRNATIGAFANGVDEALTALAAGRVRTLFVDAEVARGRTAWFGPELLSAALPGATPDGTPASTGELVDVAVRAALLTGATVCELEPGIFHIPGGVAALCRYP